MSKEFLLSDKSDKFKLFKSLVLDKKERLNHQRVVVFGKKTLSEMENIEAWITTADFKDDPFFEKKDRYILSSKAFKELSQLETPEPFGAIIKLPSFDFSYKIKKGVCVLDRLQDPGNIGTLFRTLYGLGLDGIIVLKNTCDPYHPKVLRASKGTSLKMPWIEMDETMLEDFLNKQNLETFRADLKGSDLKSVILKKPFALILGNESLGISPKLKTLGQAVHIPTHDLESLNVAVAGSIICYTLLSHEVL